MMSPWLSMILLLAPPEPQARSVLVMPLEVRAGGSKAAAESLTAALVAELRQRDGIRVVDLREVEAALSLEQQRQQLNTGSTATALELGGSLNAQEFVTGGVGALGDTLVLDLSRVDPRRGQSLGHASRTAPVGQERQLMEALPSMVTELLGSAARRTPVAAAVPGRVQPAVTAAAERPRLRLAVLYFDNNGNTAELEPLRKGLADMVITDLQQCSAVQVVEREKLEAVLKELRLQNTASFDAATAQRVGKLLGAEYVVFGSYFDVLGQFRVDGRVVRVDTAAVAHSVGVNGKKDDFISLEQQLVMQLVTRLGTPVREEERRYLAEKRTAVLADATDYGRALDAYDRGDREAARVTATQVAARAPSFRPAVLLVQKLAAPSPGKP